MFSLTRHAYSNHQRLCIRQVQRDNPNDKKGGCNAAYPYKRKAHIYMLRFLENNNLINNLKMKEKIKNQRSAGKVIPLHSKFTEPANDVSRDSEVLYGQKGKEVCRA